MYDNSTIRTAIIHADDVRRLFRIMEAELTMYNHIIEVFAAQLNRDYKAFLGLTPTMVELFGDMCIKKVDIYDINEKKFPEYFKKYLPTIKEMTSVQRFLFVSALFNVQIVDDVKRRMGMSILNFFITQAETRNRGSIFMSDDGSTKVSHETLSPTSTFHKKHVQISKKDCKVTKDEKTGKTYIHTPYTVHPIEIDDTHIYHRKWNYLIIHQEDKITTLRGEWVIEFKNNKADEYYIKKMDRLGKSSIVELTKNRTR